jgi:hypothetical protein
MAVILSLQSNALLCFKKEKESEILFTVLLRPRSLLIFCDDKYTDFYHGISESKSDLIEANCLNCNEFGQFIDRDNVRLSLTIRSTLVEKERIFSEEERDEIFRRKNWWVNSINEKY